MKDLELSLLNGISNLSTVPDRSLGIADLSKKLGRVRQRMQPSPDPFVIMSELRST